MPTNPSIRQMVIGFGYSDAANHYLVILRFVDALARRVFLAELLRIWAQFGAGCTM